MPSHRLPENDHDFSRQLEDLHERIATANDLSSRIHLDDADQPTDDLSAADDLFRLIERCRRKQQQVETRNERASDSTRAVPSRTQSVESTVSESPEGQRLGHFRILRKLGEGGHGLVYLAHDEELNRRVALKIPRLDAFLTEEMQARFTREGKAAALLSHPHIVPVFQTGRIGGAYYIVYRYVEGITLSAWLSQGGQPCDPRSAARLVSTLADAVQHAHSKGVIHRDLKPANVLLEGLQPEDPAAISTRVLSTSARITDFGLAKTDADVGQLTGAGAILGTPAYMAPEQARGGKEDSGPAGDVYSLGAILYQLLTNSPPFPGDSLLQVLRDVQDKVPLPPRRRQPSVPQDLQAICLKCLEKSPADRYDSAAALQADLQRFINGETVAARPVGPTQRMAKWCRRNPRLAALTAVSLVAVLAAFVTATIGWWTTSAALAIADQRYWETKQAVDKYFVAISDNQLLSAPGLKPLRQELLGTALDYYYRFLDQHQNDVELSNDMRDAQLRIGMIHTELGEYGAARSAFERALQLADLRVAAVPNDQSNWLKKGVILRQIAILDRYGGHLPTAIRRIDEALQIHQRLADKSYERLENQKQLGLLLNAKASVIQQQGDVPRAAQVYQESEQIFQQLAQRFPEEPRWPFLYAKSSSNRSVMLRLMGKVPESRSLLEDALDVYRRLADDHPANTSYQLNLGKALANLSTYASFSRDYETGLNHLRKATDVFDRLAIIHPQVVNYQVLRASTRKEAGLFFTDLRQYMDAKAILTEGLEIIDAAVAATPDDRRYRDLQNEICIYLGRVFFYLRDDAAALSHLEKAIADYDQTDQSDQPERRDLHSQAYLAEGLELRARLLTRQGRPAEALNFLARARTILDDLRTHLPENRGVRRQLVAVLVGTAHALECQQEFAKALHVRREVLSLDDESLRNRRGLELATSLARSGDTQQAESLLAAAATPSHPDEWVIMARAHAVLAAKVDPSSAHSQKHQQQALSALQQARAMGLAWEDSGFPPTHADWSSLPANSLESVSQTLPSETNE